MKRIFKFAGLLILMSFLFSSMWAEVRLPQVISSDMVFQRGKEIKVWGWSDGNERIQVTFNGIVKKTKADKEGNWSVVFPEMEAGGPYELAIKAKNEILLDNILIGDLWICSGQSNMEWTVARSDNYQEEIANADFPNIRLLQIAKNFQLDPAEDVPKTQWEVCSSETIDDFSAVGYFFGRYIHKEVGVPVGLISTNWGGTNIEAWTSEDYITRFEVFKERLANLEIMDEETRKEKEKQIYKDLVSGFNLNIENPEKEDWSGFEVDYSYWKEMEVPGLWENSGLPGVDGTVWYRKEFELPSEIAEKGIKIQLGRIDDSDETWVNGVKVGAIEDKHDAVRLYSAGPDILKAGKNVLAVRVEDYGGGGGFWSGPEFMNIRSGDFVLNLAGTWKYKLTAEDFAYRNNMNLSPNSVPSSLFNGMINPLLNLKVKGAIWYQGESNASRAYQYRELMPLMIECWRDKWDQPDMPFFMVQLANFRQAKPQPEASDWAELREAQLMTLDRLDRVGMAVAIDIGEADDIHPRNKQDVGHRLGLNALKIAYDKDIVFQGPMYESVEFTDGKAILSFSNKGSGLMIKDKYGYLKGFVIADEDMEFHWARAAIKNGKVVVYSEEVEEPVAVRYAWADNPDDANLYNKEGLPASPFRTDDWKGITYGSE
jgi:sialate O-acetylesterase